MEDDDCRCCEVNVCIVTSFVSLLLDFVLHDTIFHFSFPSVSRLETARPLCISVCLYLVISSALFSSMSPFTSIDVKRTTLDIRNNTKRPVDLGIGTRPFYQQRLITRFKNLEQQITKISEKMCVVSRKKIFFTLENQSQSLLLLFHAKCRISSPFKSSLTFSRAILACTGNLESGRKFVSKGKKFERREVKCLG